MKKRQFDKTVDVYSVNGKLAISPSDWTTIGALHASANNTLYPETHDPTELGSLIEKGLNLSCGERIYYDPDVDYGRDLAKYFGFKTSAACAKKCNSVMIDRLAATYTIYPLENRGRMGFYPMEGATTIVEGFSAKALGEAVLAAFDVIEKNKLHTTVARACDALSASKRRIRKDS
jgi:hypothetical protein